LSRELMAERSNGRVWAANAIALGLALYGLARLAGGYALIAPAASAAAVVCWRDRRLLVHALWKPFAALAAGATPHGLFLVAFNLERAGAVEPPALDALAARYEDASVALHGAMERFGAVALAVWAAVFAVAIWASYRRRDTAILQRVGWVKDGVGMVSFALAVTASVTVLSQAPGGTWSPDVKARIERADKTNIPRIARHAALTAVERHLRLTHAWPAPLRAELDSLARLRAGAPDKSRYADARAEEALRDLGRLHGAAMADGLARTAETQDAGVAAGRPPGADEQTLRTLRAMAAETHRLDQVDTESMSAISGLMLDGLGGIFTNAVFNNDFTQGLLGALTDKLDEKVLSRAPAFVRSRGRALEAMLAKRLSAPASDRALDAALTSDNADVAVVLAEARAKLADRTAQAIADRGDRAFGSDIGRSILDDRIRRATAPDRADRP
jgi:hypothetical protein